ncbi:hypothetical protein [Saccharicrinis aurantiacus]|uniref:hypothetical protein n=1 Tax=Saccharicrinis aurantiacus TaxID=1849719 RepID=UPI00248F8643|nr:hypothetical protein [Saccharicrinis aurantiacus]
MEKQKVEVVTVPRYDLEEIILDVLRKFWRIKEKEESKEEKLLTRTQAKSRLGICNNTLVKLIEKGLIKTTIDKKWVLNSSIDLYFNKGN